MKKIYTLPFLSLLILTFSLQAQDPTFQWVNQIGDSNNDFGQSITTDASGNVYTTGSFQGTADFEPGTGTTNLTSIGGQDIFIQKLDADGNLLWVKQMGGTDIISPYSTTIDANGNIYTTGFFLGTIDFDPGAGTADLSSSGNDLFIQKLDSNGDFVWVKQIGGNDKQEAYSISTDPNGNVFTTGIFEGTVDFDPGAGTTNFTSSGTHDIFVLKLDNKGDFVWAKQIGGTSFDRGSSLTTDTNGSVYIIGSFQATVDFAPGAGTSNFSSAGGSDIFILKLDADGNFEWANQMGDIDDDFGLSITTDANDNLYATGFFQATVDFDPGTGTSIFTSAGSSDIFIQKLDTNGNSLWAKQMGGSSSERGFAITTDASGNVFTTGNFRSTVDFDPGAGTTTLTSAGSSDIFIQNLDTNGDFVWAKQMGGSDYDEGLAITADANGNIYTTGYFEGTADFDTGTGNSILTTAGFIGFPDVFIHKLKVASVGLTDNVFPDKFIVYPNPTDGKFSIEFENTQAALTISLSTLSGQVIEHKKIQNTNTIQLELNEPNGIYILEILDDRKNKAVVKILKE